MLLLPNPAKDVPLYWLFSFFRQRYDTLFAQVIKPLSHEDPRVSLPCPGQTAPVLRGVSFRLVPGECVALVGHNGAGKTTIVKLLLRLYAPSSGRILLDGVALRESDLDELRRKMGAIFQDFGRYELSAGENI